MRWTLIGSSATSAEANADDIVKKLARVLVIIMSLQMVVQIDRLQ